jgi:hypothetical protein
MTSNPATPDTPEAIQSPSDLLAAEVTDALVDAGLITDGHKAELLTKLKSGVVHQDDWNLWVDIATAPGSADEEARDE